MKRIIKAILILAGILGTMFLEQGCPRNCTMELNSNKALVVNYPGIPLDSLHPQHRIVLYCVSKNNIQNVMDSTLILLDTNCISYEGYFTISFHKQLCDSSAIYKSPSYLRFSLRFGIGEWEIPYNIIMVIDSTRRDTLRDLKFVQCLESYCDKEDDIAKSLSVYLNDSLIVLSPPFELQIK